MNKKEEELTKELEEMFARENEEQDKSHDETVKRDNEIMQMIENVKKQQPQHDMFSNNQVSNTPERGEKNQAAKKTDTCSEKDSFQM